MARGESRKRKPGTPDYRKRFWAAVTAIVVTAGSIGVSHAGIYPSESGTEAGADGGC